MSIFSWVIAIVIRGRESVSHTPSPGLISSFPYGPLILSGVIPKCRAMNNPILQLGMATKQTKDEVQDFYFYMRY